MRFRKLRIAFSAMFGILCLLVTALWVRSYYFLDEVSQPVSWPHWVGASSIRGQMQFYTGENVVPTSFDARLKSVDARCGYAQSVVADTDWAFHFDGVDRWLLYVPHWFLSMLCASIAATPWIPWPSRFSLWTLLIATTLVAATLGALVYAVR